MEKSGIHASMESDSGTEMDLLCRERFGRMVEWTNDLRERVCSLHMEVAG